MAKRPPHRADIFLMQTRITDEEIQAAARQLTKLPRGRAAMQRLADALQTEDLCLDLLDQRAFLALLGGAWNGQRPRVREAMVAALAKAEREDVETK